MHLDLKGFRFTRWTIVGVVKDVLHNGLNRQGQPEIYVPNEQNGNNQIPDATRSMFLAVRTTVDPLSLTAAVRRQVFDIDKEQPVADVATMGQLLATSLSQSRLSALLLAIFAALALLLAAVGIYGLMSYASRSAPARSASGWRWARERAMCSGWLLKQGLILTISGVAVAGWPERLR